VQDFIYSTHAVVDSSGAVLERCDYRPYGEVTFWNPDYADTRAETQVASAFLFTGQMFDAETGLYHFKDRTLHPSLGRFLQRDPARATSQYEYASSSSHALSDPSGLQSTRPSTQPSRCCDRTWTDAQLEMRRFKGQGPLFPLEKSEPVTPRPEGRALEYDDVFSFRTKTVHKPALGGDIECCKVAAWFGPSPYNRSPMTIKKKGGPQIDVPRAHRRHSFGGPDGHHAGPHHVWGGGRIYRPMGEEATELRVALHRGFVSLWSEKGIGSQIATNGLGIYEWKFAFTGVLVDACEGDKIISVCHGHAHLEIGIIQRHLNYWRKRGVLWLAAREFTLVRLSVSGCGPPPPLATQPAPSTRPTHEP